MKYVLNILFFCFSLGLLAQNVQVDSQSYTPQELIENILIDSNCITNVNVTNVVGGDFGGVDESYGYFDASGSSFPFESGIVLSTGRLNNVEGPNNSLSDDDASGWAGDSDLEFILNENNTYNATIIEFEFTTVSDQISFRYIFASEEYQEGDNSTCQYSDLFGFLIRNTTDTTFTNIALVPDTQTPVKVTTVHPAIPNGCAAQNESYFGSWNNALAPINFNGQTDVLTATAHVVPGNTYHVKLVIADEQNYRYDSAVFLEAGSFQLSTDLGPNRLIATNNQICENDTLVLNAQRSGLNSYSWFRDGVLVDLQPANCINCGTYTVISAGTYSVEVELENGCFSYGEIIVEYSQSPVVFNTNIIECDTDLNGLTTYNLYNSTFDITNNDTSLTVVDYFLSAQDAIQITNAIPLPLAFQNTSPQQIVYARVENQFGCFSVAQVTLDISNNTVNIPPFEICDDTIIDGITDFNLANVSVHIATLTPPSSTISFFLNEQDALNSLNELTGIYTNTIPNTATLSVKIENNGNCYALSSINLNVLFTPSILPDENMYYCLNSYPQTITINAGILNDSPSNYNYQWLFNNQPIGTNNSSININEAGVYSVTATYQNGCSSTREITILPSNSATITDIIIKEASENNSITINVSGEGNYQFSLDNQIYNDSNIFTNVKAGFYTVYVCDKNGCGITSQLVSVLGFPKFFTPNNDGFNNTWKPLGVNTKFNSDIQIIIFDRYGKLLKNVNPKETGWDGTFNGNYLPNDDYWYSILLPNGKEYRGHFSLVR